MKKIEFIAPVESMRGNLSGSQTLEYAENNNPAFDAPLGRQYAKNYQPRFIGAKRASDGHKYFAVKKNSATLITVASRKRMAVLGGVGSMIGVILTSISLGGIRDKLEQSWQWEIENVTSQAGKTFRKYLTDKLYQMLDLKLAAAEFYIAGTVYQVMNPWYFQQDPTPTDTDIIQINVPVDILVKFWLQLGTNSNGGTPIKFLVDGRQGIAFQGWDWDFENYETVMRSVNVLHISSKLVSGNNYAVIGDNSYIQLGSTYQVIDSGVKIVADAKYNTTTVEPA